MHTFLSVILYLALGATTITLVMGISTMFRKNKKENDKNSTKLMQLRILFQGVALLTLALLFLSR